MRTIKKSILFATVIALATGASASLRVVSYNIYHGEGRDKVINIDRTGSVISKYNPDLVALQEVDKKTSRSGNVDQAAELGRKLGMEYRFKKAIDYRGGEYGIAVLSCFPIKKTIFHELPTPEGNQPRGALEIQVDVPDVDGRTNTISFLSTHLGLDNAERVTQVKALVERLSERGHPVIIAGDINAEPEEESIKVFLSSGYVILDKQNQFTFPATTPVKKIDFILTKDLPVRHCRFEVVPEPKVSDHRPIFGEIEFRLEPAGAQVAEGRSESFNNRLPEK